MDLTQAEAFCDHLRLAGIEATCRRWGKRKDWLCINIAGFDFLWKPDGSYDGWECNVEGKAPGEIKGLIDEAHRRARKRRSGE